MRILSVKNSKPLAQVAQQLERIGMHAFLNLSQFIPERSDSMLNQIKARGPRRTSQSTHTPVLVDEALYTDWD